MTEFLIKYIFKVESELVVPLGTKIQSGSIFATVFTKNIWKQENWFRKLKCIISKTWEPDPQKVQFAAQEILLFEVFGGENDYAEQLFKNMIWHNSKTWNFTSITEKDIIRADSLEQFTVLTLLRFRETSDLLHLELFNSYPYICLLTHPMIIKIPIISFQYFIHIHVKFSFNEIRKSNHSEADKIIDYLYEILFLQQKIAISLHEFLRLIDYANKEKNEALMIRAEIDGIMKADLIFTYLKASIEKTMILIGLSYGINNLDTKTHHKTKIKILKESLPKNILDTYYVQFMFENFSSENLDELNNFRSGILHKRGISDLQPHNYIGKKYIFDDFYKIFQVVHEQHKINSAVLLGALAMLTDKLVELYPPDISFDEIPI